MSQINLQHLALHGQWQSADLMTIQLTPPDFGSNTTLTKSGMSRFSWLWSRSWSSTSSTSTTETKLTNLN